MSPPHRRLRTLLLLTLPLLGACADLRGTEGSTVSTVQTVASQHWFRGTPFSMEPVSQADLVVNTPLANGATVSFVTWYNLQMTNVGGDAIVPDGLGGQVTEIDLVANYAQRFGRFDVSVGGIAYTYPQVRPSTKEAYVGASTEAVGLAHTLTAYYDTDLLDDYYLQYQAARNFSLDEHWNASLAVLFGYMSDGQAEFYFGRKSSGWSDVLLSGTLTYQFDENTSVFLRGAGVRVPDDELAEALDRDGLENSGLWLSIGAAWGL